MKKDGAALLVKKLVCFLIGMVILQTGSAIFILTEIGSDPFTVFVQSIGGLLNITPGGANMIITLIILVAIIFIDRKYIKLGTVLGMLTAGPCLDMMLNVLGGISFSEQNIILRIAFVTLGCIIVAFGFSILVSGNLGANPNDLIPFLLNDKLNIQFKWAKVSLDVTVVTVGFIIGIAIGMGSLIGIGTIIGAFFTGPFVQFFMRHVSKFLEANFYKKKELKVNLT